MKTSAKISGAEACRHPTKVGLAKATGQIIDSVRLKLRGKILGVVENEIEEKSPDPTFV